MSFEARAWSLVDGSVPVVASGVTDWDGVNGAWRASLQVAAAGFEPGELILQMVVRIGRRADEPTVLLMHRGQTVRRVDVNGWHRESSAAPRRETHVQGEPPPRFFDWLPDHPTLSLVVPDSVPDGATLRQTFFAAAALMGVDAAGVEWIDPPEGRP